MTLAERSDLAPAVVDVITSRWPAFMLVGEPGHDADLTELASADPHHQLVLLAENDGDDDEVLGVSLSVPSLTVTGSLDEWSDWIGLALGASGEYVIPGGLVPLVVDRRADIAIYREPNVWVLHQVTD